MYLVFIFKTGRFYMSLHSYYLVLQPGFLTPCSSVHFCYIMGDPYASSPFYKSTFIEKKSITLQALIKLPQPTGGG